MIEMWEDVPGYEGLYRISTFGVVVSLHNYHGRSGHQLSVSPDSKGYSTVRLTKGGQKKAKRVHRLMAQTWIPNPHNLPEVNHEDGNRENYSLANLGWVTTSDNLKHSYRELGRVGREAPMRGIRGAANPYSRWYEVQHPDGQVEQVLGATQFCRAHKLNQGGFCRAAREGAMYRGMRIRQIDETEELRAAREASLAERYRKPKVSET